MYPKPWDRLIWRYVHYIIIFGVAIWAKHCRFGQGKPGLPHFADAHQCKFHRVVLCLPITNGTPANVSVIRNVELHDIDVLTGIDHEMVVVGGRHSLLWIVVNKSRKRRKDNLPELRDADASRALAVVVQVAAICVVGPVCWCGIPIDISDVAVDFAAVVVVETSGVARWCCSSWCLLTHWVA